MGNRLLSFLVFCLITAAISAQRSISGKVIDDSTGEPLAGASVFLIGSSERTDTDVNGDFSFDDVPQNCKVMRVSYIGMQTQEIAIRNNVHVFLEPSSSSLDETIVVAYGTAKKSSFTGSAVEIDADRIRSHVSSNIADAISHSVAGVQITSSNGDPCDDTRSVFVRGIGSANASTEPLVVLDGIPYMGLLSNINPADVESVSVLKDAAASAIYGSRGANGVIIITSKKGRRQDAEISFDAKWGVSSKCVPAYDVIKEPGQYYELVFRQLYNSALYSGKSAAEAYKSASKSLLDPNNGGLGYLVYTVPSGENLIGTNGKLNPAATLGYSDGMYYYTPDNWYDAVYRTSFRQEYNFSVCGQTDRLSYRLSGGYLDQEGIVNNSDFKRYTANSNVSYQVRKWFRLVSRVGYTHTKTLMPDYETDMWAGSGNIFYYANNMGPVYPIYVRNADGSVMYGSDGKPVYDSGQTNQTRPNIIGNPIRNNEYDFSRSFGDVITGNWSAVITPAEGLSLTADFGVVSDNTRNSFLYSRFGSSPATDGAAKVSSVREYSENTRYMADYTTNFGADGVHGIEMLAGFEMYKRTYQTSMGYHTHLFNPFVGELGNAVGPAGDKVLDSSTYNYVTQGVFARGQYDYNEKYVVSGSFRRDGSSSFAPGHRWGSFYSVGAAWNIAKENFMDVCSSVDLLKLKVSYGEQGNDNLSSSRYMFYPYSEVWVPGYADGEYSVVLDQIENNELTWEKNMNLNIGLDFGMFRGRLSGSLEFFSRKTSDLLYFLEQPLSSGYGKLTKPVNVGSLRNTGIELQLDYTPVRNRNFVWDVNLNLTHYRNKILSLYDEAPADGLKYAYNVLKVGGSLYESYLYRFAGIYREDDFCGDAYDALKAGKAMYYYEQLHTDKDANGNVISEYTTTERTTDFSMASQYDCGDILPKLQGGLGMNFKFCGFDAGFQLGFQLGGKFYDAQYQALMHYNDGSAGMAWHRDALDAWSESNPYSRILRLDTDYSINQSPVDMFMVSSDYLSVNNITLGYTLPKVLVSRCGISSVRVYVSGENLAVLTARRGLDPRFSFGLGNMAAGSGMASGSYASLRTVAGGVSVSF